MQLQEINQPICLSTYLLTCQSGGQVQVTVWATALQKQYF